MFSQNYRHGVRHLLTTLALCLLATTTSGAIRFDQSKNVLPAPNFWYNPTATSETAFLAFDEAQNVPLSGTLNVQFLNRWDNVTTFFPITLSSDARVDSHMVYYRKSANVRLAIAGEVEFDAPVIGFIADGVLYGGAQSVFAPNPTHTQPASSTGIWSLEEVGGPLTPDYVTLLSPTRIRVEFSNINATDPLRVLTLRSGTATPANATLYTGPDHYLTPAITPTAPSFITPPAAVTVIASGGTQLTAHVAGLPVPDFQWRHNGVPVGDNTSVLTLTNVQPADAGSYTLTLTNSVDTVTSSPVTVAVTDGPADASLLTEPFNYLSLTSNAALSGQAPSSLWTPSSSTGSGLRYNPDGLTHPRLNGATAGSAQSNSTSAATRTFNSGTIPGSNATTTTLYWGCFLFNFNGNLPSNPGDSSNTGERVLLWSTGSNNGVGVSFQTVAGQAQLRAIGGNGTRTSGPAADFDPANTHLVVFRVLWDPSGNDTLSLWLDPANPATESTLGAPTSTVSGAFTNGSAALYLRNNTTTPLWRFDEFTLATSLASLPLNYPATFGNWLAVNYPAITGTDALATADPDADNLPNLVEYALDLDPATPFTTPPLQHSTTPSFQLQLSFTPAVVSGLSYIIQSSPDLTTWTDTDITNQLTVGQPYTYTDPTPVNATTPRRFLRLKISE